MGTPAFAVPALAALLASSHEVIAAYSQPPRPAGRGMKLTASPIHQLAESHGIPVYTPTSLKTAEAQAEFAALAPDIAVVVAYGLLLPQAVLDAPKLGCINIHPSDLPRWRGAAPIQRTLMAGDRTTACCIIQLEAGLDTGPILAREPYIIPDGMNAGELHDVMAQTGAKQLVTLLDQLASAQQSVVPLVQSPEGVTYAEKITKADRIIDWSRPASQIIAQIRGLAPSPSAITEIAGEIVKIYAATVAQGDAAEASGMLLDDALTINAGDGTALKIDEIQRPGRARQSASELLHAWPLGRGIYAKNPIT
jgi:methionyl-tRNA formyltransferase